MERGKYQDSRHSEELGHIPNVPISFEELRAEAKQKRISVLKGLKSTWLKIETTAEEESGPQILNTININILIKSSIFRALGSETQEVFTDAISNHPIEGDVNASHLPDILWVIFKKSSLDADLNKSWVEGSPKSLLDILNEREQEVDVFERRFKEIIRNWINRAAKDPISAHHRVSGAATK